MTLYTGLYHFNVCSNSQRQTKFPIIINDTKPVKQIFATDKSTIDTDNPTNTVLVLLFL